MTDKYLLFDLDDSSSKEVATVLSNASARKILSYLSEHDSAESDISKALKVPLSTVHYNVQNLLKHNLVEIKDTLYSQKGNEVHIYTAARKAIVLAPKGSAFWSSIRQILPVVGIAAVASLIINFFPRTSTVAVEKSFAPVALELAADESLRAASIPVSSEPNIALWFFIGAIFVSLLYFLYSFWKNRK